MDLRVSGKDLIRNHLIFSLLNHRAVWAKKGVDMLPRSYFVNGHIGVNNKKMSKSLGNFFTMKETVEKYGADAMRCCLADAGDSLEDANFVEKNASTAILKLNHLHDFIKEIMDNLENYRTETTED